MSQTSTEAKLEKWVAALPSEFEFYHLGNVEIEKIPGTVELKELHAEDYFALGFGFHGDMRGLLVILLEKNLDLAMYSELGNILAAKIATEMNRAGGLDVMISPPYSLSAQRLSDLLKDSGDQCLRRAYLHQLGKSVVRVETLILPAESMGKEFGNA